MAASSWLQRGVADEVAENHLILHHADSAASKKAQRQDQQRIDAEDFRRDNAGKHAVHHQFAMREIDDPHHAESEAQSDGEDAVNSANQNAAEDRL